MKVSIEDVSIPERGIEKYKVFAMNTKLIGFIEKYRDHPGLKNPWKAFTPAYKTDLSEPENGKLIGVYYGENAQVKAMHALYTEAFA